MKTYDHDMTIAIDTIIFESLKATALVVDVRDHLEFQQLRKIPDAINIPYQQLVTNPEKYIPNKKTTIITVCNAGNRSTAAAKFLRELGYQNSYVLATGIYGYYK